MALRQEVARRARHRCEYCHLPEQCTSLPFQLDHVIAGKHDGATTPENLAFTCLHCNSFKGPNIAGRDPQTGQIVRLFHPRQDDWSEHFAWDGPLLIGRTPVARATIAVLRINLPYRVAVRRSLLAEGICKE